MNVVQTDCGGEPGKQKSPEPGKQKSPEPGKEKSPEPGKEKSPDKLDKVEENPDTPAKSAGEIRQSLSTSTTGEHSKLKNPAEQAIPRDAGDDTIGSGEAESEQTPAGDGAEGGGGGWNWGWGSSLLDAATNSIETFSSQVGESKCNLTERRKTRVTIFFQSSFQLLTGCLIKDTFCHCGLIN